MSISPLRRIAAVAAIAGVTALGGVAIAPAALAYEVDGVDASAQGQNGHGNDKGESPAPAPAPSPAGAPGAAPGVTLVVVPAMTAMPTPARPGTPGYLQSPLPNAPVTFKYEKYSITLPAAFAQAAQTLLANSYVSLGHPVTFNGKGVLVIGDKVCNPAKPKDWNKGCVQPVSAGGGRF